ncbi:MFS transporter [Acinetobacter rudis]|uniref:MFS transporter n=1 Tax=Acinetobacter rudis TaxID=632955 RepID=UPI0028101FCF|nr:MFS transporter [Acinetobacter rudis]MDQ8952136.1 MFS transporter [Acinetobacter rudis]
MLKHYLQLFKAPGSLAFTLSAFVARLALPMIGIGIITLLAQLNYGYARAGIISAIFVLSYALISPQVSRLVDQHGQGTVVLISAAMSVIGLSGLAISAYSFWPFWSLVIFSVLAGFIPSMSAMVRARWTALYRDQTELRTAYSLESVLDELTFIIGPPLCVGMSVLYAPAGLIMAAGLLAIGVVLFTLEKTTQPQITHATTNIEQNQKSSVISLPNVQLLAACMIALGFMVGIIDVASVAFAQQQEAPLTASLVLSAYALSSCLAGLTFGAIQFKSSLQTLLLWSSLGTAIMSFGIFFVNHVYMLSIIVALLGVFFAPTMISLMSILEQQVANNKLTEALTWLLAALNIGVAVGAAATGQLIESYKSAWAGLSIIIPSAILVLMIATLVYYRVQQTHLNNTLK